MLRYRHESADDGTSWRRARLFADPWKRDAAPLDMSGLRTPTAAFSDGDKLFALFLRFDPARCAKSADCPTGMLCSSDPSYTGKSIGECEKLVDLADDPVPDYCRDSGDCVRFSECRPPAQGVCMATKPFDVDTTHGPIEPSWYRDDPKRSVVSVVHVAAAIWPERPADYATIARFATNRFLNASARTVAHFDPQHPERNDYRPGYHTLLIWGRNAFNESYGAQSLPFLLYVPLEELRGAPDKITWHPRFFAGYDDEGNPAWSDSETDAKPIYGGDALVADTDPKRALEWLEPEFDQVAQMSLSWVAPLSRWVMLYGGDLPAFIVTDPKTHATRPMVNLPWAAGAIHMRAAEHPWGAARIAPRGPDGRRSEVDPPGWSSAKPVLTRQVAAPYLACGNGGTDSLPGCVQDDDSFRVLRLAGELAGKVTDAKFGETLETCLFGEAARRFQDALSGDLIGRLYAPNILEEWTEDVTDTAAAERGERSAELYWNVSTWNPYQVVLFKTRLTANPGGRGPFAARQP